jgi:hypothetical protein
VLKFVFEILLPRMGKTVPCIGHRTGSSPNTFIAVLGSLCATLAKTEMKRPSEFPIEPARMSSAFVLILC